ncbi:MAG TPA: AMP-binding protein [Acidimicrobiales bacterium]|nr:AMP-binding protein [Acidimicrobiales bacterium]
MNLASAIDAHPAAGPALVSQGETTTYGELRSRVAGIRGGLVARGVAPGDRVAVVASNNPSFVAAYLGVLGVGGVAVPLNPLSPPPELGRELAMVGARLALVDGAGGAAFAGEVATGLPDLDVVAIGELMASEPAAMVERADDDLAVLLFTSGIAGLPRAAMLTHGNLRANIDQIRATTASGAVDSAAGAATADDVALGVIPLFHIFGLNALLGLALTVGATVVLVERFDPPAALALLAEHGITVVSGVPTMWRAWVDLPPADAGDANPMASVRLGVSGAAALDPELRRAIAARYGVVLAEGYGLTEASPVVTTGVGHQAPDGSIGLPLPGVLVRLIDRSGMDALVGDPGEVWVKGPNVFAGYWDDPEATRAALTEDGWLRTGDLAVVDDDGFLWLVDRAKDLIIVSGFNVVPAEVEAVLMGHPGVAEAAVVSVPDPRSGEAVKAFIVPVAGADVDEAAIVDYAARHLARYKCPSIVTFVDQLPYGLAGKLLRRQLR